MVNIIFNPEDVWETAESLEDEEEILIGSYEAGEENYRTGSITEVFAGKSPDGVYIDVYIDDDLVDGDMCISSEDECEETVSALYNMYLIDNPAVDDYMYDSYDPLQDIDFSIFSDSYMDDPWDDDDEQTIREYELTNATMGFLSTVLGDSFTESECPVSVIEDCKNQFIKYIALEHGFTGIYRPMEITFDGETFKTNRPYVYID